MGEPVGISGIAKYAMACHPEKKISLIRGPNRGFLATAGTAVHELGHTIGMHHDFDDKLGSKSCKSTPTEKCCFGFMHYGNHKNEWSDCSMREFRQNHRKLFAPKNCLGEFKRTDKKAKGQKEPAKENASCKDD